MNRTVHGVGINDRKYPSKVNGEITDSYDVWKSMLYRCTKGLWNRNPNYEGTTCSESFKSYSFFHEWCQEQIGFNNRDENRNRWHLDKDLLSIKCNESPKLYSESTCVFIPQSINNLLLKRDSARGGLPVGVCWHIRDKRYTAQCGIKIGKREQLGSFDTPEEAFQVYKAFKEALVKQVANDYKASIDPRAYQALMNYEVNIND